MTTPTTDPTTSTAVAIGNDHPDHNRPDHNRPDHNRPDHNLWPAVSCLDVPGVRRWLAALGFDEGICIVDDDGVTVHHSEMLWPEGGRVMVSSAAKSDPTFIVPAGAGSCYVVCDDPDVVFARAGALGAHVLRPMEETDYDSRGFTLADSEGNRWSFGTYAG
ncbi:MAG: glyoxalase [Lapillicoccus sp.]